MFNRHVIRGLLAGVAILAASSAVQACAAPCGGNSCCDSCAPAVSCAPVKRTITVYESVPEYYETTRTTYRTVQATEKYTAYRTECVPETRTCTKTVYRKVPEWKDVCTTCYRWESCWETRTTYKKVTVCKQVCTVKRKCVDQGHWVEQCVPVGPSCFDRLKKSCGCGDCCEPCPRYKTKKVWCPNKVWVETPCVKTVRCTECVPCTTQVCVKKKVPYQTVSKVCTYKCIPETVTHTYTVNVSRCVPYEATRTVCKCVPVVEKVTACRMVCKPVTKEVECTPVSECCESGHRAFGRLFGRKGHGGGCCN
jgi:hypothetical protein